jgi:hypothetical protein
MQVAQFMYALGKGCRILPLDSLECHSCNYGDCCRVGYYTDVNREREF